MNEQSLSLLSRDKFVCNKSLQKAAVSRVKKAAPKTVIADAPETGVIIENVSWVSNLPYESFIYMVATLTVLSAVVACV